MSVAVPPPPVGTAVLLVMYADSGAYVERAHVMDIIDVNRARCDHAGGTYIRFEHEGVYWARGWDNETEIALLAAFSLSL